MDRKRERERVRARWKQTEREKVKRWKEIVTCNYVVPSISFPTFFVQAFKIVIDS